VKILENGRKYLNYNRLENKIIKYKVMTMNIGKRCFNWGKHSNYINNYHYDYIANDKYSKISELK
jgi:hypothetical protein